MNELATPKYSPTDRRVDLSKLHWRLFIIALMMAIPAVAALLLAVIDAFGLSLLDVSFAFAFCVAGAMASHVLNEFPKGDEFMMTRLMTSMFVRAGLPLIAVVLAKMVFESAFSEGFVYLVVLFYLVGLISDSVLSTIRLRSQ